MDEEALKDAHKLFLETGYKGDLAKFKNLISTNPNALKDAHQLFVNTGYNKSIDDFSTLVGVKKKVPSTSISTTPNQKLVSEKKVGSSGTQKPDNSKKLDELFAKTSQNPKSNKSEEIAYQKILKNKPLVNKPIKEVNREEIAVPTKKDRQITQESKVFEREQKMQDAKIVNEQLADYETKRLLSKEESDLELQKGEDEISGTGFINTVSDYGKKAWNAVAPVLGMAFNQPVLSRAGVETDVLAEDKEEFVSDLKKQGKNVSSLTSDEIYKGAKELFLKKKLNKAQEDKETLLIESLPEDVKKKLEIQKGLEYGTLKDKDLLYTVRAESSKKRIEDLNETISTILEKNKRNETLTPEEIDFAKNYETKAKEEQSNWEKNQADYFNNQKQLLPVEQEYKMLKKSYDDGLNLTNKFLLNSARVVLGFAQFEERLSSTILGDTEDSVQYRNDLAQRQADIDNIKETEFANQTEGWNGIQDAFKYATNVFGEQLPNMLMMSVTGGASIPLIGASSAGNKFGQLQQSNNEGKTFFTPTQILANGFATGLANMLETQTLKNVMQFKRFVKAGSASPTTREMLKDSYKETSKKILKGIGGENAEELGAFFIEDFADETFLGVKKTNSQKKEQIIRLLKDTTTFSALLQGVPHVISSVTKPFASKTYTETLDKQTKEIVRLTKELQNTNLSETDRRIIEGALEKTTKESSDLINNFVKNTVNLSDESKNKIIELEDKSSKTRVEAEEINKSKTISKETKQKLLSDLKTEYVKSEELRNNIIEGKTNVLDVVSPEIKEEMKSNALNVLLSEKEGSNEAQFTNDVIEQKAIELYNNQIKSKDAKTEIPITETKPQTEVQEPTNAQQEEVKPAENISPIENVVSPEVAKEINDENGNPKSFYHGSENDFVGDFKNNNPNIDGFWFSDSKENANTYGKNVKTVNLDIKNPLIIDAKGKKFTDDIEVEVLASYPNEKPYLTKIMLGADEIVYMVKNGKRKNSFIEIVDRDKYDGVVIKNFVDPSLSSRSEEIQTTVVAFDNKQIKQNKANPNQEVSPKNEIINEAQEERNIDANGNVPIGDNADLQQREQQPEVIEVQSTADVGESKPNVKRVKSLKDAEYDVSFNEKGEVTKINSVKDGREIPKFTERVNPKTGKTTLVKNANYARIEADSKGEQLDSRIKSDDKKVFEEAVLNFEPNTEYDVALNALANGAKVSMESLQKELGNTDQKWATNQSKSEQLPSIEKLSEQIWEESGGQLDQMEIRNQLIDIIQTNPNVDSLKSKLIEAHNSRQSQKQEDELRAYLGSLSEKDLANYESIKAEDDYISELSDEEATQYYEQEYLKSIGQTKIEDNGKETANKVGETETPSFQKRDGETKEQSTKKERVAERKKAINANIDELANALKDLLPKTPNTEGLKQNGLSQDDLINFIAESAKVLAGTTIEISEAINQVIEHLKSKGYDVDVDADEVLAKFQKEEKKQEKKELKEYDKDSFEVSASVVPNGETGEYLSGKTIEKYTGEKPQNDQEYLKVKLEEALLHGVSTINKAKEQFGNDFVSKVLEYLDTAPISPEAKALTYVSLENELNKNKKDGFPDDLTIQKKLDLVRAKRQAFARSNSLALNMNRLQKFAEAGFNPENLTDKFFSEKTKEAKKSIEETIQVTSKDVNSQDDIEQSGDISEDVKDLIQKGIDKEINEIYKKLPSSRRAKADKAINALEKIQKKLKANAYDATIGVPVAIIDGGISVIKNAIKAGVNIADAIELGINHIKDKYGKDWNNEDRFRKDMSEGFEAENVELKEKTKADESIKGIVKQALIGAGYSRNVKVNGETVKRLDWVKLAGEEGSIENIQNKVEEVLLKEGGYTKKQIAEMQDALKEEYNRLSAEIIQKGLNELEKRNLIKPSPNRKSESKRLAELYNMGLLEKNENEYDNLLNKVLGLSEFEQKIFNKIKAKTKALSDIYNAEVNGKKITEHSLQTVANDLNHEIKELLNSVSYKEGNFMYKLITLLTDYAGLSQKALLGGLPNLIENVTSGRFAGLEQKLYTDKVLTPELRKQIKKDKKVIYNDITKNAGLYYGDTNTSLVSSSRFEDWVNGKTDNRVAHAFISAITLRSWLDGADSRAKVGLSSKLFIKNAVEILTSKSNPNGAMKREDAIKFVSESLTGDKFKEALETSKSIIDEVNSKQDKKQLKDTPEAIHRFAMNLVKENLMQDDRMTMEQIETAFKSGYKSAGRDIGHEANNPISRSVNMLNASLTAELEKAVSEKRYGEATALSAKMMVLRTIINPFVGGGTNWVILGLEKSGNPLGYISTIFNATKKQELDLGTVSGIKNMSEALYRKNNYQASLTRNIIGTGVALALFAGMNVDIDDEEDAKDKLNKWLEENKWAKRYFEKLSPEALVFMISLENKELGKHLAKNLGINGDTFNNTSKLLKSLDKETTSTSGKAGQVVGSPLNSPLAWKTVKDITNIMRGLKGLPEIKTDYKATGFWNGYFQGGLVEFVGMRPNKENTAEKPKESTKYTKF